MIPKFRAWHKEFKKMQDVIQINFEKEQVWLLHNEMLTRIYASGHEFHEVALMQWTGLQDKNGKDIYAGDILSVPCDEWEVGVVKYDKEFASWNVDIIGIGEDMLYSESSKSEVIGNIYENSDLIK